MRVSNGISVFCLSERFILLEWYLSSRLSLLQILLPTLFTHPLLNVFNLLILPLCNACHFLIRINQNQDKGKIRRRKIIDLKDYEF
jgi:hypothetical protein